MKTVYIASPYTKGDVDFNVRRSLKAADKLLAAGFIPFAPLLTHFWHLISPKPYETWTEYDNEWVSRCDIFLRLPGESSGADAEVELAKSLGIPVIYSIDALLSLSGIVYRDGEPCQHVGCLQHVNHPCEGCGRVNGRGTVTELDSILRGNFSH